MVVWLCISGYNDPKFLLALTTATQTKMSQLKPIDLQRLTYGLSLIYHRNTSFLAKLLAHAETVLPRFTESEVCTYERHMFILYLLT